MLPKLISIGSFYIPTYGVLVALGFLAGLGITLRLARKAGMPAETISNLAVYCAIAGLIGAKLFMFLFDSAIPAASSPSKLCRPRASFTAASSRLS
jgi:phosphatidylglycerol:prolipoprotein diacylglycerol transferase